jgi:hypothetical protein
MTIIKKIIMIPVVTIQGIATGFFLNLSWHFFLAKVIGWGDTAPDWYFNIQKAIFVGIFLFGLMGWIFFSLRSSRIPWTSSRGRVWKEISGEDASS